MLFKQSSPESILQFPRHLLFTLDTLVNEMRAVATFISLLVAVTASPANNSPNNDAIAKPHVGTCDQSSLVYCCIPETAKKVAAGDTSFIVSTCNDVTAMRGKLVNRKIDSKLLYCRCSLLLP